MSESTLVDALRAHLLQRSFGAVRFWGFAPMRPHDQAYELISTHQDGDRLDLVFVHASRQGLASVLSVWAPEGLEVNERGLSVRAARQLKLDDLQAWDEGAQYRLRSDKGEGQFDKGEAPALSIEF